MLPALFSWSLSSMHTPLDPSILSSFDKKCCLSLPRSPNSHSNMWTGALALCCICTSVSCTKDDCVYHTVYAICFRPLCRRFPVYGRVGLSLHSFRISLKCCFNKPLSFFVKKQVTWMTYNGAVFFLNVLNLQYGFFFASLAVKIIT